MSDNTIAGIGGKRPQLEISIDQILLDDQNPRLIQYLESGEMHSQEKLTEILYENFDTEDVALSLIENGYFDEEPIIVIPENTPEEIPDNYDDLKAFYTTLIEKNEKFIVLEGNRRISSIKMITDNDLRNSLGIDKFYPKTENPVILEDIKTIPCIIYPKRGDVNKYLGVRHIAGLLKWDAFAKAHYISNSIDFEVEKGLDKNKAIKEIQKVIGDRSDKLKKQYVTYKLYEEASKELEDFDVRPIVNKFSLLTVMYNSPNIREYIGVQPYSKVDFENNVVPYDKFDKFEQVLTWIFGNKKKNIEPVLTDSRKITNTLSHIVSKPEAIAYLDKYKDIEGAYERTSGEREFLIQSIDKAHRTITESLKFAYKYRNDITIIDKTKELENAVKALKANISTNE